MASWDELFQKAAETAPGVEEFYADYGAAPEPVDIDSDEAESERGQGKGKLKGKGKGKGKGQGKGKGKGKGKDKGKKGHLVGKAGEGKQWRSGSKGTQNSPVDKGLEEFSLHPKVVESEPDDRPPIQEGESFANACFAAALKHEEEKNPRQGQRSRPWKEGRQKGGRTQRYWREKTWDAQSGALHDLPLTLDTPLPRNLWWSRWPWPMNDDLQLDQWQGRNCPSAWNAQCWKL